MLISLQNIWKCFVFSLTINSISDLILYYFPDFKIFFLFYFFDCANSICTVQYDVVTYFLDVRIYPDLDMYICIY